MLSDTPTPTVGDVAARTGWHVEPRGACRGEVCVPLRDGTLRDDGSVDIAALAEQVGIGVAADPGERLWALGPTVGPAGRALESAVAPELRLSDVDGNGTALSDLRGIKVVLVAWASWCGCADDLPLWSALRERLHPSGVEIVTVALDAGGPDAVRPFVERAAPRHPSLMDTDHVTAERFGITNVPSAVWIDETGTIVRPAEPAWPGAAPRVEAVLALDPATLPPRRAALVELSREIRVDPARTVAMIEDWAARGSRSEHVLSPAEVVARSAPRSPDDSRAAAHVLLARALHDRGRGDAAEPHWEAARTLAPHDWTRQRQGWALRDPEAALDRWAEHVRATGPQNYYRAIT